MLPFVEIGFPQKRYIFSLDKILYIEVKGEDDVRIRMMGMTEGHGGDLVTLSGDQGRAFLEAVRKLCQPTLINQAPRSR
ncbi:MAG TPA: hypothetical protein VFE78_32925 [Gemmataceae bacterium]|jgi:hypothetical protein|nr:hypothetical protein [Gemmataceae bacterium]